CPASSASPIRLRFCSSFSLFCTPPPTSGSYTLSLHDALPICRTRRNRVGEQSDRHVACGEALSHDSRAYDGRQEERRGDPLGGQDRKSTRLNSSHLVISYAVFCLKKKNSINQLYKLGPSMPQC